MSVYELLLYACLTSHGLGGNGNFSKTCLWQTSGELFSTEKKCEDAAKLYFGKTIMGDVMYADATNMYEATNCVTRHVND